LSAAAVVEAGAAEEVGAGAAEVVGAGAAEVVWTGAGAAELTAAGAGAAVVGGATVVDLAQPNNARTRMSDSPIIKIDDFLFMTIPPLFYAFLEEPKGLL